MIGALAIVCVLAAGVPATDDAAAAPAAAQPIGPAGVPLDLLPISPLGGSLGYLIEAGAAAGVARLLGNACLVPVVGPVLYFVVAPRSIADAIEYVATRYTTTGAADRRAALLTATIVEGAAALYMLGGQALVIAAIAGGAVLAIGLGRDDVGMQQLGTAILVGDGLGALLLLVTSPLAIAAGIGGPYLEALAYRSFDAADVLTDPNRNQPGEPSPRRPP